MTAKQYAAEKARRFVLPRYAVRCTGCGALCLDTATLAIHARFCDDVIRSRTTEHKEP